MKALKIVLVASIASVAVFAFQTQAQSNLDHSKMSGMKMEKSTAGAEMTDGEVRKIDKEQGKITLKHVRSRTSTCLA